MQVNRERVLGGVLLLALTATGTASAQGAAPALVRPEPPPSRLAYQEGQPVPEGYRLRSGPRKGLVIGGAIVGGAAYGFGVVGAIDSDFEDHAGYLLIPVAGPWLMLAAGSDPPKACPAQEVCADGMPDYRSLFVAAAGVAQAVGTVLFVVGLTSKRRYLERKELEVSVVPASLGQGAYGLGVIGAF
ncbi:MAG: hypothetical protein EOO73_04815 [Myxococcales bacterium]|nr:MAG: hypothetical protein EOO73_04815 [Myxococcales bacterium]